MEVSHTAPHVVLIITLPPILRTAPKVDEHRTELEGLLSACWDQQIQLSSTRREGLETVRQLRVEKWDHCLQAIVSACYLCTLYSLWWHCWFTCDHTVCCAALSPDSNQALS